MGYTSAVSMKEHASQDVALYWHFSANHYPPLPTSLIPVAKRAIKKANRGEYDAKVSLRGTGVTHRRYGDLVPVRECVSAWHLDAFIEPDPDDYPYEEE